MICHVHVSTSILVLFRRSVIISMNIKTVIKVMWGYDIKRLNSNTRATNIGTTEINTTSQIQI